MERVAHQGEGIAQMPLTVRAIDTVSIGNL